MSERVEIEAGGIRFYLLTDLLYTESDEWVKKEDGVVRVGVTDFAQKELKDVVAVDLPEKGRRVKKGEAVATLDSIKTTADIYSPVTGEIVEVNERLLDEPELINKDPYGEGWIFAVKLEDPGELEQLLTWEQYAENVKRRKESG